MQKGLSHNNLGRNLVAKSKAGYKMVVFFVEFQDRSYYRKVTFMSFFDCWPWVFFIFMAILRLLYVKKVTDMSLF